MKINMKLILSVFIIILAISFIFIGLNTKNSALNDNPIIKTEKSSSSSINEEDKTANILSSSSSKRSALNSNYSSAATKNKIVVKQSGGVAMLIAECNDRDYISNNSDHILEGVVKKVESKWNKEKTMIFTYSDLKINKYLKGSHFEGDEFQLVTAGGEVDGIGVSVEDQPILHENKNVRVYFKSLNGEYSIVCASQGIEEI